MSEKPLWRVKVAIMDSQGRAIISNQYLHAEAAMVAEEVALARVRVMGALRIDGVVQVVRGRVVEDPGGTMNLSKEELAVLVTIAGETLRDAGVASVYVRSHADGQPWFQVSARVGFGLGEGPTLAAALERMREDYARKTPDGT